MNVANQLWDVVIIGAGAAGLMCAKTAAARGKSVLVLEHNDRIGKKILISGGGRCNFTNLHSKPENYISENSNFCKSAFARFQPQDFIHWIEKNKIPYFEKKLGQLFCQHSAKAITKVFEDECVNLKVQFRFSCRIESISKNNHYILKTSHGNFISHSLVIATGGLSFENLGASPLGYELAKQFDLKIIPVRPGLVPLLFSHEDQKRFSHLSGLSLEVIVQTQKKSFREHLLFTHKGLSGPAILQISSYWQPQTPLYINLVPDQRMEDWLIQRKKTQDKMELKNRLQSFFPEKWAKTWCEIYASSRPIQQYSEKELRVLGNKLNRWEIFPAGTEGFSKAEVTLGGVDTRELSSKTMECLSVKGLYFIGEVVDVTGHLGGHNFQWAWASGFAAGKAL
ncbi:MAG: NAD(P)/FAD-dependent oxidoreductase [Deltaproteobacteria bacterium]|nr:NAD(P)/FAD-dependent oxidoreductase [Deltaproteobacteria bacterium]